MLKPRPYDTWEHDKIRMEVVKDGEFPGSLAVTIAPPAYRAESKIRSTKRMRKMAAWLERAADYIDSTKGARS